MLEKPKSPHRPVLPLAALTVGLAGSSGGLGCGDESEPQGPAQALARPELETFPVPLDEEDPGRGSVDLHYLRYPAADPGRRIGALLVHFGGLASTMCMDLPRSTLSQHEQLAPLLMAEAPLYGGSLGGLFLPCVFWPVDPEPFNPELEAIPSILLINAFDDARTPHLWTERTAARIPGRGLIEVGGFQHGSSLRGNECVDDIVTRYLTEGELPEDTRCRS